MKKTMEKLAEGININKNTKVILNLGIILSLITFIFAVGFMYASFSSDVERNGEAIQTLEQQQILNTERRNDTDRSIVRIETRLEQIFSQINIIGDYIKEQ